ncbi:PREDICTED: tRNA (guanine(26)-N(2))-dimethyltransferase-like [Priapulus caudatus]|uniref:tRNA (guanine(26)-N(2))-dimethyltransferase n=1 Tax=Priapulus caudatus TaxID=37621 RepID=A0ABM1EFS9_PRICU|nr:PREDICTED: tRNA (guanine(26)-N(2))-dimethyltransferase-like [Priapulus caudatus]
MSLKAKCCHEMALRLLLNCIESHAAQYSRYTVPVLCMSADFCLRVFVKIYTSAEHANSTASKRALVYQCTGCETFNLQHMGKISTNDQNNTMYKNSAGPPVSLACRHCSYPHHLGGPIWAEPLYETTFLTGMIQNIQDHWDALKSSKRIIGMLTMMMEELQDAPLYYVLDKICSVVQVPAPKIIKVRSALLHAGFRVSGSHCNQGAIKTDAPSDTIWDIVRCLAREEGKPIKPKLRSQAEVILSKEPSFKANFEKHPDADPISKRRGQKLQTTPDTKKRQPDMSDVVIEKHDGDSIDGASKPKQSQGKKRKKKKQANPDFLKRFPCKKYKRGECTLGETCRYSHDLDKVSRVKPAGTEQTEEQPDLKAENNSDVRAGAEHGDYEPMLTDNPNFLSDNPQNFQAF